jgi:phage terminase large subunit-like protein
MSLQNSSNKKGGQKIPGTRRKAKAVPENSGAAAPGGFWFDESAADRAVQFFAKCLTHGKGEWAGQPLTLSPWQENEIIRPLFGWKRADGTRKYRTMYCQIPRKAGKSTLAAGIALYLLFADGEPGAEIYGAAADREQARIVFDMAKGMIDASTPLRDRATPYKSSIVIPSTASSYKVLSSDAHTKHGFSAHGIIIDEVHALPNRDLWDVLTTSTGARRQPLTVAITTAGYDRHSLCYELYDYACRVRDGVIDDPGFLPVIYEAGKDDDWTLPATWHKAHPGLGVSVKEEYFAAECAKAQQLPSYENTFKRLLLNIWTESSTRWIPADLWDACGGEQPDLDGLHCYAGLDLASTTDIAALVLAFPIDGVVFLKCLFFVPEEGVKRRSERDHIDYATWIREGHIIATEGAVIDYDVIRATINTLAEQYQIKEIAIDRWNATQISTQLAGDGFDMIGHGQGFASLSAPTKELERRVLSRQINHGANPVLAWMASNVQIEQDAAGNMKPSKSKSTSRIDGIAATLMSLSRLMMSDEDQSSVYDGGAFSFM